VFVVGGSVFPQNGAVGPTEPIGLLAYWAADGLKDYLKKPAGHPRNMHRPFRAT